MPNPLAITPVPLDAQAASGAGAAIDLLAGGAVPRSCVSISVEILSLSGTNAALRVELETSPDGTSGWRTFGTVPALALVGASDELVFVGCGRFLRANWTLAPATTVVFSVTGEAHQLYADASDLNLALPSKVVASLAETDLSASTLAANVEAEGYLNGGYTLPLISWGRDLRKSIANMLAFDAMKQRGFQPGGTDELIVKGRDDAILWLGKVAQRRINPPGIVDSTPAAFEGGVAVASKPSRGW